MKRIDVIEQAVSANKTPPEIDEPPPEAELEDKRYVVLAKPIQVGERKIEKLFCDVTDLSAEAYFRLVNRFRTENHYIYSTSLNKLGEDIFQGLVIAELNQITFEDLRKLSFKDIYRTFQKLQGFLYV